MHEIVMVSLMAEIFFCFAISAMSFIRAVQTFEIPMAMSSLLFLSAGVFQYMFLVIYSIAGLLLKI